MSEGLYNFIVEESRVVLQSAFVDMIILVPIEFEMKDDGYRKVDPEYQKRVQDMMEYYVEKYDLGYKTVRPRGTVEERLNFLRPKIDRLIDENRV